MTLYVHWMQGKGHSVLGELPGTPVFTPQRLVDDPDAVIFYELDRDDLAFRVADDAAVGRVS